MNAFLIAVVATFFAFWILVPVAMTPRGFGVYTIVWSTPLCICCSAR